MINYVNNVVPMMTQPLQEFSVGEDTRFTRVKIWLMHLGLNHNGSVFTKEVVERAIPTLSNTPIVGSVGFNSEDQQDFQGHEIELNVSEDGELKLVNKTIPYGVIPTDNNAQFEMRLCDDGIEREYLTCEGLLWNKWDDAVDIIMNKSGATGQSMELASEYSGNFSNGKFEFTDFKFNGACLLGKDEMPAMENSTVEMIFTQKAKNYIDEKINLYNLSFTKNEEEGGTMAKEEKVETEFVEAKEAEEKVEAEVKTEETETKKPARKKAAAKAEVKEEVAEEAEEKKEENLDTKDHVNIVVEEDVDTLAEVHKAQREDAEKQESVIDRITVLDNEYSAKELEDILTEKTRLENELFSLKKEIREKEVNALFSKHKDNLTPDEISTLKAKELSVEDTELHIFSIIGKKLSTGEVETKQIEDTDIAPVFTALDNSKEESDVYGGIFKQYLKK